ncbi:MAG TPA: UdgX family uracil-DNA binding protein [Fimbriimonas sp.]|nr:UdgX family uracil-DNA binding protein [Fimbriimonas sp.]
MATKLTDVEEPYYGTAAEFIPEDVDLGELANASKGCKGCHLWRHATQTVFGEGPVDARVVMVGEQPGDKEDLEGHPFVGPAGKLLDDCLEEAGIPRDEVYITNAVKHFKWIPSGPRRLHQKPNKREVTACLPWLQAELDDIKPEVIVALGATAAQALLGDAFRLTKHRGEFQSSKFGKEILATLHPSAVLRAPDAAAREEARQSLIDDLRLVGKRIVHK